MTVRILFPCSPRQHICSKKDEKSAMGKDEHRAAVTHSPPRSLTKFLRRSTILREPSTVQMQMSPVLNHPSFVNSDFVFSGSRKYPGATLPPRIHNSPRPAHGMRISPFSFLITCSESVLRYSFPIVSRTPGTLTSRISTQPRGLPAIPSRTSSKSCAAVAPEVSVRPYLGETAN